MLEAAGELFLENGYEATSTADIARKLGILRGSVYYYMDTKEGLLFELMEDAYEGFVRAIDAVRESDDDALAKLRRLVEQHIVYLMESRIATTLFLTESRSLSPEHRKVVAQHEETYRSSVADLIREGQRTGVVRDDVDAELATMLFLGAVNWIHRWYGRKGKASVAELARQFSVVIGDGLRAGTAGAPGGS